MATEAKYRILVVEDEELINEMLEEYFALTAPELELVFAKDLGEARRKLKEGSYALCVVDCNLPDGTACDLFAENIFHCPVIITTGYVDEEKFTQVKSFTKTPIFILKKPYLPADLHRKIMELLQKAS